MKDDLTPVFAQISQIQQDIARRKAENRRLVMERMPVVSELFAQLEAAGMSPKMVKLQWFDKGE